MKKTNTYNKLLNRLYGKGLIWAMLTICLVAIIIPSVLQGLSTANTVSHHLDNYSSKIDDAFSKKLAIVNTIAAGLSDHRLTDDDDILYYLDAMAASNDSISAVYACFGDNSYIISGTILCNENFSNVTDSTWYKDTLWETDGVRISNPAVEGATGKIYVTISQIVYAYTSIACVVGVDIYIDDIITLASNIADENSYSFIVAGDLILAHPSKDLHSTEKKLSTNNTVSLITDYTGTLSFVAATDCDSNDWKVVYVHSAMPLLITIVAIICICVLLCTVIILIARKFTSRGISKLITPINDITLRANAIADGDFTPAEDINGPLELVELNDALTNIIETLKTHVGHIVRITNAISNGTINVNIPTSFNGEFAILRDSLVSLKKAMNKSASDINAKSLSITEYTNEIDKLIKNSEEKSSKEASLLSDISNGLASINLHSHRINLAADAVKDAANVTNTNLVRGNREMKELLSAMEQIEASYNSIASLVYDINGLSEKTNLLSLNASIEAARMGDLGKEYASVADEINMLSSACSKAINKIELLINDSNAAVEKGRDMVNSTSASIAKGITDSQNAKYNIDEIVFIAEQQQDTIENVDGTIRELNSLIDQQ